MVCEAFKHEKLSSYEHKTGLFQDCNMIDLATTFFFTATDLMTELIVLKNPF